MLLGPEENDGGRGVLKVVQSVLLLLRVWRDVGEMGVGGGGPGVSWTVGVEGWEGVSSSSEQAASSQESATGAFVALDLLEGEMESFFRELSRPEIL